jgi:hypothetical protein
VNMPWPTQWKGANQRRVTKEKDERHKESNCW